MGRITRSPHIVLFEQTDSLLKTLYTESRDKAKRDALRSIIHSAMEQRAAYVNGNFYHPMTFLLLTSAVFDVQEIRRLEKQLAELEKEIKHIQDNKQESATT